MKATITFDRIGRSKDVQPLQYDGPDDPEKVADAVYAYARPHLMSRDVDVFVAPDTSRGNITVGFNTGGSFTIEKAP